MENELDWSIVLPTYRRQDVLRQCLEHLEVSDLPKGRSEVRVYDNGSPDTSEFVLAEFRERLPLSYTNNGVGHGMGYSLCLGSKESRGKWILEINDDALVCKDFFTRLRALFESDSRIGVVGVRAIEAAYTRRGEGIGRLDSGSLEVIGNFDISTDSPVDVEHVYGFCYAYRRELIELGAVHDPVLLSRDYSSGNRIETDHCLMAKRLGYRVVYDGGIGVVHLAKPRGDMDEFSPRWRLNHVRNTLYLYLKHFGWFGRSAMGFRFCFTHDLGFVSLIKRPTKSNWLYFWISIKARASGVWHWFKQRMHSSTSSFQSRVKSK